MSYLESFRFALRQFLLREVTEVEAAEIAVIAFAVSTYNRSPLVDAQWRAVCTKVLGAAAVPPPPHPNIKTAGLDFSALNVILVNIQPRGRP